MSIQKIKKLIIQASEINEYSEYMEWSKKNNCHLYRDMENEFDDDTILEPRQRKPLGSIYQFIFLTTNPKLKDYPSRQKSLFMTTSHGGSGSEDVFGRYQYECFFEKGN